MTHDLMCPFPFLCLCDFIAKVRADEAPKAVARWVEQGAASDDWMKVWQVRDYAEELEAKVRADTLDKAEEAVEALVLEEAFNSDIAAEDAIAAINSLRGQS